MDGSYLEEEFYNKLKEDISIFDFLQNGSLDGVWYWDLEKPENEWMSPRFWEVLGYDPKEMKHLTSEWQDKINQNDLKIALENFYKHIENTEHSYDQIVRYTHKNGSIAWIRCRGMAIRDENGKPIRMLGTHNDLTLLMESQMQLKEHAVELERLNNELEKKVQEEVEKNKEKDQLILTQSRQAAMGDMIAMIAHQWRQPITTIGMVANNIQLDIELDEEIPIQKLQNMANTISEQTQHLAQTIDDFRDFFKPNKNKLLIDVCKVVKDSINIVGKTLENNNIEYQFINNCNKKVNTLANELMQVILNIINNAKDALLNSKQEHSLINIAVNQHEDCVKIVICDNGGGVPDEHIDKIFKP